VSGFKCTVCGEGCPFPTQPFENLAPGQDPSEMMSTCGCGATHKLTLKSGHVCETPPSVQIDRDWRKKLDAKHKAERDAEMQANLEKSAAHRAAGRCPHCEGTGKVGS
jgi:hypothetical protein